MNSLSQVWVRGAAAAGGDGARASDVSPKKPAVALRDLRSQPEEVCFTFSTPRKSGECWAERNTPTWSHSAAGFPKQIHVTDPRRTQRSEESHERL